MSLVRKRELDISTPAYLFEHRVQLDYLVYFFVETFLRLALFLLQACQGGLQTLVVASQLAVLLLQLVSLGTPLFTVLLNFQMFKKITIHYRVDLFEYNCNNLQIGKLALQFGYLTAEAVYFFFGAEQLSRQLFAVLLGHHALLGALLVLHLRLFQNIR